MTSPEKTGKHPYLAQFRNLFFAGLFVTIPVFLTFWLLQWAFNKLDGPFRRFLEDRLRELGIEVPLYGAGLVLLVLFIMAVGVLARMYAGKLLIRLMEALLQRVPVVNKVYAAIKQITDSLLGRQKGLFYSVVLVEFPRKGIWTMGFYTGDAVAEIVAVSGGGRKLKYVFLPTSPNPTSGYLLLVPEDELRTLPLTVDEALRLIVSGGAVSPAEELPGVVPPPESAPGEARE